MLPTPLPCTHGCVTARRLCVAAGPGLVEPDIPTPSSVSVSCTWFTVTRLCSAAGIGNRMSGRRTEFPPPGPSTPLNIEALPPLLLFEFTLLMNVSSDGAIVWLNAEVCEATRGADGSSPAQPTRTPRTAPSPKRRMNTPVSHMRKGQCRMPDSAKNSCKGKGGVKVESAEPCVKLGGTLAK
jgi:hypothetical protein